MKLVEILAREWKGWPVQGHLPVSQGVTGRLYVSDVFTESGKTLRLDEEVEVAEDMATAEVTRAQWEAERSRIAAEEAPTWHFGTAEPEPDMYEQELWDKVAVSVTQAFITGHITQYGHGNAWQDTELVSCAADYADAFMAERAKRLKGVK